MRVCVLTYTYEGSASPLADDDLPAVGYGRCDLRMDAAGALYLLEINPNCAIFYPETDPGSADLILLHDPAGHRGFVAQILDAALARHRRRRQSWAVRADRAGRYGTFYNEAMPAFECACSSPGCRGTIRGTDYLEPFVDRYGEHVSDYVRARRAARSQA